ncbi:MAG TPA: bifunctional phosphoribosylaminoimidazolecarboxamide formyltransferase/IMP cyclohydrolase, partial [Ramlibacter sp.]|nr:bifunctional phosphoribosylaminoimidazolecarboxamide formyltransferase/IMP cyclohydrolase [Ramlibacter sp.]
MAARRQGDLQDAHIGLALEGFQRVGSGLLVQTADNQDVGASDLKVVTTRQPTPAQTEDLLFAWTVARFVKSN